MQTAGHLESENAPQQGPAERLPMIRFCFYFRNLAVSTGLVKERL